MRGSCIATLFAVVFALPNQAEADYAAGNVDVARVCVDMVGYVDRMYAFAQLTEMTESGGGAALRVNLTNTTREYTETIRLAQVVLGSFARELLWQTDGSALDDLVSELGTCVGITNCDVGLAQRFEALSQAVAQSCYWDFHGQRTQQ